MWIEGKNTSIIVSQRCLCNEDGLLTNATVVDDAIKFVAANPINKEPTIRNKATGTYETEIEQEKDIQPINLVNEDVQEQQQLGVENNTCTKTTTDTINQVF